MKHSITQKIRLLVLIVLAAWLGTFLFSNLRFVRNLELKSLDWRFKMRGKETLADSSIVIVSIDDQTFSSIQTKWPYPRSYFTKLIRNLNDAGARLIVFDLEFTEPYSQDPAQDVELAHVAQQAGNVIFAGKIVTEFGANNTVNQYVLKPMPELLHAGVPWGVVNIVEDSDGFLRRYLLGIRARNTFYPALSVEALQKLSNGAPFKNGSKTLRVGKYVIEKMTPSTMLMNYIGPAKSFPTYSFVNVLDDAKFDIGSEDTDIFEMHKLWDTFRNKIVFVGSGAEELQDVKLTPFYDYEGAKRKMPGVEVHANALYTMLHNTYIHRSAKAVVYVLWFILGLIIGGLVLALKPIKSLPIIVVLIAFLIWGTVYEFVHASIWLPMISPLLMIVFGYLGNTLYILGTEQREKLRYRKIFQQYVSKNVVDKMLESGKFPEFGGSREKMTVLFSDIRSFTSFTENNPPEKVVGQLTEYLTVMTDIVLKNDGTLDKFVGDEIMALFGAPYPYEDHAFKACVTAHEMIRKLKEFQLDYAEEKRESYFNIGIGINTGEMVLGNLGSRQLFDYTVIGDAVNLGARLEGVNKFYKTNIIFSEYTYNEVKDRILARELDKIQVKGKMRPVKIYELLGIDRISDPEYELLVHVYSEALSAYRNANWYEALKGFRKILRYFPKDGPSNLYIKRCLDLMENPPREDWEAVYTFSTK